LSEICSCPNCLHPTAHHAFEDVPGGQRFVCVDCPGNTCVMNAPGPVDVDDSPFHTDTPVTIHALTRVALDGVTAFYRALIRTPR
jgi:hypothetical protein